MSIRLENGRLILGFDHTPTMLGELEHWQYDTFKTHWRDRTIADAFVTFALNPDAERMRYAGFRRRGVFVGSAVVDAGCKINKGRRLKQSGMRWTVRGANAIITLRCCRVSDRWEEFWETRAASR